MFVIIDLILLIVQVLSFFVIFCKNVFYLIVLYIENQLFNILWLNKFVKPCSFQSNVFKIQLHVEHHFTGEI